MYKLVRESSRRGSKEKYNDKRKNYKKERSYSKEKEEEKESDTNTSYRRMKKKQKGETCSDIESPTSLGESTKALHRKKEQRKHKGKLDMSGTHEKKRKFESSRNEKMKRIKIRKRKSRNKERTNKSKGSSFAKYQKKYEISTDSEQSNTSSSYTYNHSSSSSSSRSRSSSNSSSSSSSSSSSRSGCEESSEFSSEGYVETVSTEGFSSESSESTESTESTESDELNESVKLRKRGKENAEVETKKVLQKKELNKTGNEQMSKNPFDDHIYDSKEMIRLTISILQNYNYLNNFKILYKKLDNNKKISLENVKDKRLKKKLRHLFRAWRLEKINEFYRKPKNFTESISEIFYNLIYYFLSKIDFQLLKENINKRKNLLKQIQNKNEKEKEKEKELSLEMDTTKFNNFSSYENKEEIMKLIKTINDNNSSSKCATNEEIFNLIKNVNNNISLREMHEEGIFKKSRQAYKEFLEKSQTVDLWGKTEQEQKYLLNLQKNPNERKMFDREKDLCSSRFIKSEDYEKLIKNTKQHINDKFQNKGYMA